MKVLFVASAGGHLDELLTLKEIFKEYEYQILTEENPATRNKLANETVTYLPKVTRDEGKVKFARVFATNYLKTNKLIKTFQPDVIVTTGAQISYAAFKIGKKHGTRNIYIESIARVNSKSKAGSLCEKYADTILVQWEEMLDVYENATYIGRVM